MQGLGFALGECPQCDVIWVCDAIWVYDVTSGGPVCIRVCLQNTSSTLMSEGDMQETRCMAKRCHVSFPFLGSQGYSRNLRHSLSKWNFDAASRVDAMRNKCPFYWNIHYYPEFIDSSTCDPHQCRPVIISLFKGERTNMIRASLTWTCNGVHVQFPWVPRQITQSLCE